MRPQDKDAQVSIPVSGRTHDVKPYSWSLADLVEHRLFGFLFSEDDIYDPNFGGLIGEVEEWLTYETAGGPKLSTNDGVPRTFETFVDDFKAHGDELFGRFAQGDARQIPSPA